MKTNIFKLILAILFLSAFVALAQTNIPTASVDSSGHPLPIANVVSPLLALVTVAVPLIVAFIKKKVFPNIPSVYLPLIAVAIGLAATYLLSVASLTTVNPVWGALLGAAGVGLREIKDQILPASPTDLPAPKPPGVELK